MFQSVSRVQQEHTCQRKDLQHVCPVLLVHTHQISNRRRVQMFSRGTPQITQVLHPHRKLQ